MTSGWPGITGADATFYLTCQGNSGFISAVTVMAPIMEGLSAVQDCHRCNRCQAVITRPLQLGSMTKLSYKNKSMSAGGGGGQFSFRPNLDNHH